MARSVLLLACVLASCSIVALAGRHHQESPCLPVRNPLCPDGTKPYNCLVEPCATQQCKDKCAKAVPEGYNVTVQCVDNYCGGCNCDCCLAAENICSVDASPLNGVKCCAGTVCAFANSCIQNPFAKCGTICIPPEESADKCKKERSKCDPSKIECCSGLSCRSWRGSKKSFKCQKCKALDAKCSVSKQDCCPYLTCKKNPKTKVATCQPKRYGF